MDVVIHVFGLYIVECDYSDWRIQDSVFGGGFLFGKETQARVLSKLKTPRI